MDIPNVGASTGNAKMFAIHHHASWLVLWNVVRDVSAHRVHTLDRHKSNYVAAATLNNLVGSRLNSTAPRFSYVRLELRGVFDKAHVWIVATFAGHPIESKPVNCHINHMTG